jgi:hypothetical protein
MSILEVVPDAGTGSILTVHRLLQLREIQKSKAELRKIVDYV